MQQQLVTNVECGIAVSGSNILDAEVADNVEFAGSGVYTSIVEAVNHLP